MDAAVDTMVLIYSMAFPADSKFLASGTDVKVVRAYRLQFLWMVSPQCLDVMLGCPLLHRPRVGYSSKALSGLRG